ncbi:agarase [Shewanella donghaensis]|uniref:agarase n=1 Tax=Shewanella donghaensis TaxID=238836 RepID=UPI001315963A|nr:agarase [Shewanella donghaensis]
MKQVIKSTSNTVIAKVNNRFLINRLFIRSLVTNSFTIFRKLFGYTATTYKTFQPSRFVFLASKTAIATFTALVITGCSPNETVNGFESESSENAVKQVQVEGKDQNQKVTHPDVFSQETVLTTLVDFNDPKHLSWLTHKDTQSRLLAVTENTQLAVNFSNESNIAELAITPDKPWHLASYDNVNMAFDVKNTSDNSIQLYLNIANPEGQYQSRSISLPVNYEGTVYFPLAGIEAATDAGLWGDIQPWDTDDKMMIWRSWRQADESFTSLSSLTFFTIGLLESKSVIIDDIRIRKNPTINNDAPLEYMANIIDRYGQNAKYETPQHVSSDNELKALADKELAELSTSTGMPNRSQYGGYTRGPKLDATGYFRTEKVDGKWWMVDPEGHLFFSHGPANVRMANMSTITGVDYDEPSIRVIKNDEITPEDSMGIVDVPSSAREKRFIISKLRNKMFQWLPEYNEPLADHYSYRRSTHKGPVPHGETFSFYRANLERRYGQSNDDPKSYLKKWHQVTAQRMHDWGFTSFGNWVDPAFYQSEQVPYFANGWIIGDFKTLSGQKNHWGLMPDPYDPIFARRAQITIDAIANNIQASPWCAGIFIDNEKSWGEREGSVPARYGVILDALSKDAQFSPAKSAFTNHIKAQYQSIEKLNTAWGTNLDSWSSFMDGVAFSDYNEQLVTDLSRMLEMLGEQYFLVVHDTLEKVLPNHLYMGARMANWGMPDEIIKASLKYSDVLSFNIYEEGMQKDYWDFLEEVDLPVVVGEFHIGTSTDSGMYNPGIVHAANQQDRARMYKAYMKSVLDKPYMVGAHWFQYVDEPISGRAFDGENANIGFVTVTDVPYPEMIKAVKEVTSNMYQNRYGK